MATPAKLKKVICRNGKGADKLKKKTTNHAHVAEYIFLILACLVLLLIALLTKSSLIILSASILGFLAGFFAAKGKIISRFLSIIAIILFLIISLPQRYYGEVIIILLITLPIKIKTLFTWLKNKDPQQQIVKTSHLSNKEWRLIAILSCCAFVGLYFLLKFFNTNLLLVSTFSALTNILSAYLLMKRNKHSFSFAVINDVFRLVLWLIPTIRGDWSLATLVVTRLIYLSVDLYGYVSWIKMEAKQTTSTNLFS